MLSYTCCAGFFRACDVLYGGEKFREVQFHSLSTTTTITKVSTTRKLPTIRYVCCDCIHVLLVTQSEESHPLNDSTDEHVV